MRSSQARGHNTAATETSSRREVLSALTGLCALGAAAVLTASCGATPAASSGGASPGPAEPEPSPAASETPMSFEEATAAAFTPPAASPTPDTAADAECVSRPELSQGPYFVEGAPERSDVRSDPSTGAVSEGLPLQLTIVVSRKVNDACTPIEGARVDIWHCDARGMYSGIRDPRWDTTGSLFLRGYQRTDTAGRASFTTIYPGWYPGRAVHIHFKIRGAGPDQGPFEFTSQLFFDEETTDAVHSREPYANRGRRNRLNADDGLYRSGGEQLLLPISESGDGYTATFGVALAL